MAETAKRPGIDQALARMLAHVAEKEDKHWQLYLAGARAWLAAWSIDYT